jgi:CheY-like chemotaxis protein
MTYTLEKAKILIVEDMQPMLEILVSILGTFGFKDIYAAGNAQRAFELYQKNSPDLVITDWMMEPEDGLELIERIRSDPFSPNKYVPVIIMTGFSARIRVEKARDHGVTEFLVKPFTAGELFKRIEYVIEKPRKFVDADNFFGPDRRRRADDEYEGPRRREGDDAHSEQDQPPRMAAETLRKLIEDTKNQTG